MKSLSASIAALALASTTSASAAPKVGDAKPTNPSLPHVFPHAFEPSAPEPKEDPCAKVLSVAPFDERFPVSVELRRLAGPSATTLAGAKKISTNIEVEVTASKRRLFLGIFAQMTSHDPSNGQTGYYAAKRPAKLLDIPVGCEIASVTKAKGLVGDAGPVTSNAFEVLGSGLVERASCALVGAAGLPTCKLAIGKVEVRLRPAQVSCAAFELQPTHVMGLFGLTSVAGDGDLDDDRINLDYRVDLVGYEGRVSAKSSLAIEQIGHDHSRFTGATQEDLFIAAEDAPGCRIKGAFKKTGGIRITTPTATDAPRLHSATPEPGGVLINARCVTDTPGVTDPRLLGCGIPTFRPISVDLEPDTRPKNKGKWHKKAAL